MRLDNRILNDAGKIFVGVQVNFHYLGASFCLLGSQP